MTLAAFTGCTADLAFVSPQELEARKSSCYAVTQAVDSTQTRRLNRNEIDNAFADWFRVSSSPFAALPSDGTFHGFPKPNNVLPISNSFVEAYSNAIESWMASVTVATSGTAANSIIVPCLPTTGAWTSCAQQVVSLWGFRLFRRPLTSAEVNSHVSIILSAQVESDTFSNGVKLAIEAMLLSPHFLMIPEVVDSAAGSRSLSSFEAATSLALFVWESVPDDWLLGLAQSGSLSTPAEIAAAADRMIIENAKGERFFRYLAQYWLIGKLPLANPDPAFSPGWTEALRTAMSTETRLFLRHLYHENRPVSELMSADYTFANRSLATHYGAAYPGVGDGSEFRRVTLPAERRGILTHGSVLAQLSDVRRASPIKRGHWVLEKLLCSSPPPAPPDVDTSVVATSGAGGVPLRQRLTAHSSTPRCFSCHAAMDPIGFSLDHFGPAGQWLTVDAEGHAVDAAGFLDGKAFNGAAQMSSLLQADPRLTRCVSEHLAVAALARSLKGDVDEDRCFIRSLMPTNAAEEPTLRVLVQNLVSHPRFRTRRVTQ